MLILIFGDFHLIYFLRDRSSQGHMILREETAFYTSYAYPTFENNKRKNHTLAFQSQTSANMSEPNLERCK